MTSTGSSVLFSYVSYALGEKPHFGFKPDQADPLCYLDASRFHE